jgi:hypothetical protein
MADGHNVVLLAGKGVCSGSFRERTRTQPRSGLYETDTPTTAGTDPNILLPALEPAHRIQAERLQDPSAATCLSAQAFNSLKSPPKARRFNSSYIIEHFMISLVSRSPAAALCSQLR